MTFEKLRTLSWAERQNMTLTTLNFRCRMQCGTTQLPAIIHANNLRFADTVVAEPGSPRAKRLWRKELFYGETVEFKVRRTSFKARVDILEERSGFIWLTLLDGLLNLALTLEEAGMTGCWR
jgi:hypothetical protein